VVAAALVPGASTLLLGPALAVLRGGAGTAEVPVGFEAALAARVGAAEVVCGVGTAAAFKVGARAGSVLALSAGTGPAFSTVSGAAAAGAPVAPAADPTGEAPPCRGG
jgi:hypothetical protein